MQYVAFLLQQMSFVRTTCFDECQQHAYFIIKTIFSFYAEAAAEFILFCSHSDAPMHLQDLGKLLNKMGGSGEAEQILQDVAGEEDATAEELGLNGECGAVAYGGSEPSRHVAALLRLPFVMLCPMQCWD